MEQIILKHGNMKNVFIMDNIITVLIPIKHSCTSEQLTFDEGIKGINPMLDIIMDSIIVPNQG